jgi:hypothetical protein
MNMEDFTKKCTAWNEMKTNFFSNVYINTDFNQKRKTNYTISKELKYWMAVRQKLKHLINKNFFDTYI